MPQVFEAVHFDDLDLVLMEVQQPGVGGDTSQDMRRFSNTNHLAELVAGADGRAGLSPHQTIPQEVEEPAAPQAGGQ